jgi:hypothetical protein
MVVGVLSSAANARQRQAIRDTWAYGHVNVFFLVAGPWEEEEKEEDHHHNNSNSLAHEFVTHGDIVWFDHPDEYYQITWSIMGFIYLAHTQLRMGSEGKTNGAGAGAGLTHLFKTDDDSYVKLEDMEQLWSSSSSSSTKTAPAAAAAGRHAHLDYAGHCLRGNAQGGAFYQDGAYPDYAAGYGYQLSASFVACIARTMAHLPSINVEDANIGVFAHYCQVPCVSVPDYYAHRPDGWVTPDTFLVQHRAKTPTDMDQFHRLACATSNISNVGCHRYRQNAAAVVVAGTAAAAAAIDNGGGGGDGGVADETNTTTL